MILRKGNLVARVLSGSWRSSPFPPLDLSKAELDEVTPLLCGSGAAALAWRRIAVTDLRDTYAAEMLHQAYRLQSLQAELLEKKVEKVFRLLRQARVDAVLAKGWVAARIYFDAALRPYSDIDICVPAEHFNRAEHVFSASDANDCSIDLHKHFHEFKDRSVGEIFARSQLVPLGEERIRTLGPEDHLALLCIHFLKHGAWRPLWLCDIAAAIESLPENFDWNVCLGSNKTRAKWIMAAIGLARRLLGAEADNLPITSDEMDSPAWLVDNVLRQWADPFPNQQAPMNHPVPMAHLLRHPAGLFEGLRKRWPNAILATVSVDGDFNNLPRLPYQMANCISRMGNFLIHR